MSNSNTTRIVIASLAVAVLQISALASKVNAQLGPQIQRPFNTPTVSPYLNLFRNSNSRGGNAILNYYGLVRPQQQSMQQNNALRNDFRRLTNRAGQSGASNQNRRSSSMLGITGHSTSFMSLGGTGGGGAGGGGGGAGGGPGNSQQNLSGHPSQIGSGYSVGNSAGFGGGSAGASMGNFGGQR